MQQKPSTGLKLINSATQSVVPSEVGGVDYVTSVSSWDGVWWEKLNVDGVKWHAKWGKTLACYSDVIVTSSRYVIAVINRIEEVKIVNWKSSLPTANKPRRRRREKQPSSFMRQKSRDDFRNLLRVKTYSEKRFKNINCF